MNPASRRRCKTFSADSGCGGEGVGVGWVSVFEPADLKRLLQIPEHVLPVAYLCLGYVREFLPHPELEIAGWLPRIPLEDLIFFERWGQKNGK